MPRSLVLAILLFPAVALADTCPWLDDKSAAEVILVPPNQVTHEKNPVTGSKTGMVASTTCRFKDKAEITAQLAVVVMEYGSEAQASAAFEGEKKNQGSRAKPAKAGPWPGFFTETRNFTAASTVVKGNKVIFVSHVLSQRVKDAIAKDPDGAVLSTHEIARRVATKL